MAAKTKRKAKPILNPIGPVSKNADQNFKLLEGWLQQHPTVAKNKGLIYQINFLLCQHLDATTLECIRFMLEAICEAEHHVVCHISGGNLQNVWSNDESTVITLFDFDAFDGEEKDSEGRTEDQAAKQMELMTADMDAVY